MQIDKNYFSEKVTLRKYFKNLRNQLNIDEKTDGDKIIYDKVIHLDLISEHSDIFIYVSNEFEVDTKKLIAYFMAHGHKIAVPCCTDNHGSMCFYYIKSLSDLQVNHFGILEPDIDNSIQAEPKQNDICILPCLGFDSDCYRIGYGKGYYDRFLATHKMTKIGLCYDACRVNKIPRDQFDVKLDVIITDKSYYNY